MSRQLPAILVMLALGISGCIAAEPETTTQSASGAPPAEADAVEFDESSGAIAGVVTDEELQPIAGASVAIAESSYASRSALDGSFSINKVPPGDYILLIAALGFESTSRLVPVVAGQATPLRVALAQTPVVQPRVELYQFTGYITCTIGAFGVLSEECGQGLQTPVGTYGTNPNNKIDWKWNYTEVAPDFKGLLVEMTWAPGSAAATQLTLYLANKFTCIPSCDAAGPVYCDTDNHGPPPQRCGVDDLEINEDELPWDMTARAWGAPVEPTEVPNVVLEQAFTMYRTEFYGEGMPSDYTAIADT